MSAFSRSATIDGLHLAAPPVPVTGVAWLLTKLTGWDEPAEARTTITERPGADGSVDGPSWAGPRTVTVTGFVKVETPSQLLDARQRLAALAGGLTELEVVAAGQVRTARVRRTGRPAFEAMGPAAMRFQLQFTAPDHRKYGPVVVHTAALPQDAANGLDFGAGLDFGGDGLDFGELPSAGAVIVRNPGTAPSDPVIRLVAGSTGLVGPVEVEALGRRLVYAGSLAAGQVVELDAAAKSVLLDGYANRRDQLATAQWWQVPPRSEVSVSWAHQGSPSPDARLEVLAAPAYH